MALRPRTDLQPSVRRRSAIPSTRLGHLAAMGCRIQLGPARQRRELDPLGLGMVTRPHVLAPKPRSVFGSAIEPCPLERRGFEKRADTLHPWPVLGPGDETFL